MSLAPPPTPQEVPKPIVPPVPTALDRVRSPKAAPITSAALGRVGSRKAGRRVARVVIVGLGLVAAILTFVPWQQSVAGTGEVSVYAPMDRPQTVEAFIPGRLVEWRVREGEKVTKGQVLARIEDIDSKFLDREGPRRIREGREFAETNVREAEGRIRELEEQRRKLQDAQTQALDAQREAVKAADARVRSAAASIVQAEQNVRLAERVARASAGERKGQAQERIAQARQTLEEAIAQQETMRLRANRVRTLVGKGLNSVQQQEFADNDFVKARTATTRARQSLEIAKRDVTVGVLAEEGAGIEIARAKAALLSAREAREVARADAATSRAVLGRLQADTSAAIAGMGATIQSAKETRAKSNSDLRKAENDEGNMSARAAQTVVRAPRDGRIVRLLEVGAGGTVKAGDVMATIAPETADRMVELYLADNDAPLVAVGRKVRLQFAGWPALQVSGMPGVAVGSFGGTVAFVDPVTTAGKGAYGGPRTRVLIRPDRQTLPGGRVDDPWPAPDRLRPGTEAYGWIMLDSVPLGAELWRQFNRFPPRMPTEGTKVKDPQLGPVKIKNK